MCSEVSNLAKLGIMVLTAWLNGTFVISMN